jgi:membrane peptidoglycan carboxypeptidase
VLLGLILLAGALGWVLTPSADDVQQRVAGLAREEGAVLLRPGDVPPRVVDALVATEDERFFQHHGVDVIGIGRAVLADIRYRCLCQGGSTITQQLVKQVYLGGDDAGLNKVRGLYLAFKVEDQLSKRQILADYLTVTPLGYSRYGLVNAACAYFHSRPEGLDVAQSALLAGMPQAPAGYDPILHPRAALDRRAQVLGLMEADGYITTEERMAAQAEPLLARGAGPAC